MLLLDMFDRF